METGFKEKIMSSGAAVGTRLRLLWLALAVVLAAGAAGGRAAKTGPLAGGPLESCRIGGGLCVQVGCADVALAAELARTDRFLVHVLAADAAEVDRARERLHSQGLYGLASVDRLDADGKLPYTENLVNLLVVEDRPGVDVPPGEMVRVLCPGGVVFVTGKKASQAALEAAGLEDVREVKADGRWIKGRKPWPAEMDCWTHPRHAADGNAVSHDKLVGPPRRIRWVASSPWQHTYFNYMVSAARQSFYGGVLARDSFNGLQLWRRSLSSAPDHDGFKYRLPKGGVLPVTGGELLFAVSDEKLLALDGTTGKTVHEYPKAGTPGTILHVDGTLIAVDKESVRALEVESGRLRWKYQAAEPRYVVAGDGAVYLLQGIPRRGQKCSAVCLDLATGKVRWQNDDYPFIEKIRRFVYHRGLLACEISTLSDDGPGNVIHVASAADGKPLWSHTFVPGMSHRKQARAMFVGDLLWILETNKCTALDGRTGKVKQTHKAGWGHCYPPVATVRYMFAGEMDLTSLETGQVDANRITKGVCGREAGFMPANGLIYVAPKTCVCWPMVRGYVALAPQRPGGKLADEVAARVEKLDFVLQKGIEPPALDTADANDAWPCYRHDAWRSGSTTAEVPTDLKVLWTTELGGWPKGPIADDWRQNPVVPGPVTPPVIDGGLVYVARPDAHQLVALDARTGAVRWRFTVGGRIDTAPTIHRGLCLFGSKSGWVYCLRADNGKLVWRRRAAPLDERIIAYGQLESPWPVPGSVLVVDNVAFFAAGRHPLAAGGILAFAVDPPSGKIRWVGRLNTLSQHRFYGDHRREYDCFDLLHREGNCVAMSRRLYDRATGQITEDPKRGFAHLTTGGSGVMVPQGVWSYAPRQQSPARTPEHKVRPLRRPLVVFRDNTLYGCSEDKRTVYRRDFNLAGGEQFDTAWHHNIWYLWSHKIKELWRSQRLARGAKWSVEVFPDAPPGKGVAAMVLTRDKIFVAGCQGGLTVLAAKDGKPLARHELPAPAWDGMAAAAGRLFVSTRDGQVICLGTKPKLPTPAPACSSGRADNRVQLVQVVRHYPQVGQPD